VFQSVFQGKTIRVTIGSPEAWTISKAREKTRELQRQIDEGRDPREVKAQTAAAAVAKREEERRQHVTAREAWGAYIADRTPHWGERHRLDHEEKGRPAGVPGARGRPLKPGPPEFDTNRCKSLIHIGWP
jgi:hypothetical protein